MHKVERMFNVRDFIDIMWQIFYIFKFQNWITNNILERIWKSNCRNVSVLPYLKWFASQRNAEITFTEKCPTNAFIIEHSIQLTISKLRHVHDLSSKFLSHISFPVHYIGYAYCDWRGSRYIAKGVQYEICCVRQRAITQMQRGHDANGGSIHAIRKINKV